LDRSGQAESDFADFSREQFFGGAENVPRKMQFLGENIGGAPGKQSKGHAVPIFGGSQAVHDFVEGAIATAGNYQLPPVACGVVCEFGGVPGSGGFGQVRFNALRGKNAACLVEQAAPGVAPGPGVGVVNQERVVELGFHSLPRLQPIVHSIRRRGVMM